MANKAREDLGLFGSAFESVSQGDRIFKNYESNLAEKSAVVAEKEVQADKPFNNPADRSNSWDGGEVNNKGNTPKENLRKSKRSAEEVRASAKRAAERDGTTNTGGRNKGGLVSRPKK